MPLPSIARPPRTDGMSPLEATDTVTRWLFDVYQAIYSGQYTADEAYARGDEAYELAATANDRTKKWEAGTNTISDAAASVTVPLNEAQSDANYKILVTVCGYSGAPAANSRIVKSITNSADSFQVEMVAAPGAGTSITFNWLLVR